MAVVRLIAAAPPDQAPAGASPESMRALKSVAPLRAPSAKLAKSVGSSFAQAPA
jgi:hypothetical protein